MPGLRALPSQAVMVSNLRRLYSRANSADHANGADWYPRAQRIAREWSEHYGYSVDTVACVIAAISPQTEWSRNLIIADDILAERAPSIGGIWSNIDKAIRLRNEDVDLGWADSPIPSVTNRMRRQFKSGPKVTAFANNIAGNMYVVTVDTHAAQAAIANPGVTISLKPNAYERIANAFYSAASYGDNGSDHTPAEYQAILWCAWKRLYSPEEKRAIIRKRKG